MGVWCVGESVKTHNLMVYCSTRSRSSIGSRHNNRSGGRERGGGGEGGGKLCHR